jgi:2,3-dihydroxybenzoate-AMP ligase
MLEGCTAWPAAVAEQYRRKGYWRGHTLGELVDEWAREYGSREAIVAGDERVSYRELQRRVERLAGRLLGLGLRPRERVLVQLPNVPEFIYLYYACAKAGLIPVMALPPHRFSEISYLAEFLESAAYAIPASFRGFDYLQLARQVRQAVPGLRRVLVAGDSSEFRVPSSEGSRFVALRDLLDNSAPDSGGPELSVSELGTRNSEPHSGNVALFLLSGGTTGLPKLIPRTHDDYAYNSLASAELCGFGPDTVYMVSLPISHNFPLSSPGIQGVFQTGGKVVLLSNPEPEEAFALIERERVTATALVPALAIRWMDAVDSGLAECYDISSLRLLQVGGARLNPEAARRVGPTLGCQLQQVFGMAEGLLNYTRLDDPEQTILETQGRPLSPDDEIRIVDEDDRDVPRGQPGNLLARGPYTIRGYYRAPEHNRRAFTTDGFYRTGDVVRQDEHGNLMVEGRDKDMINRGGEKISAEEVENLILAHPSVFNVAVVAMPDALLGERSCAYVIPKAGASLSFEELIDFLQAKQIARFKLPERLELAEIFPLTSVGKVSKKDLREEIARKLEAERTK